MKFTYGVILFFSVLKNFCIKPILINYFSTIQSVERIIIQTLYSLLSPLGI